jgi:hypothetical protein
VLHNATLLRIDAPPGTTSGPALSVRCAAAEPSLTQTTVASATGAALTLVCYLRLDQLPPGVLPLSGGVLVLRLDADGTKQTLTVTRVMSRPGRLAHAEVWLAPEGTRAPGCSCTCAAAGG